MIEAGNFIAGTEEDIDEKMEDKELKAEAVASILDKSFIHWFGEEMQVKHFFHSVYSPFYEESYGKLLLNLLFQVLLKLLYSL